MQFTYLYICVLFCTRAERRYPQLRLQPAIDAPGRGCVRLRWDIAKKSRSGCRGFYNRQRNLRGACAGLGRRGFEKCWICGFSGPWRLLGRAPEAKIRYPEKTRAMQGRKRGHFGPLITGLWPKISLNRRGEERLFFNTKFLTP